MLDSRALTVVLETGIVLEKHLAYLEQSDETSIVLEVTVIESTCTLN